MQAIGRASPTCRENFYLYDILWGTNDGSCEILMASEITEICTTFWGSFSKYTSSNLLLISELIHQQHKTN